MPLKVDPDNGTAIYLKDGQWVPSPMKVDPNTKKIIAFDGESWQAVDVHGPGMSSLVNDVAKNRSVIDQLFGIGGPRYQTWPEREIRDLLSLLERTIEASKSAPPGSRELTENLIPLTTEVAAATLGPGPATSMTRAGVVKELPEVAASITGASAAKRVAQHIVNPKARAEFEIARAAQRDEGPAATIPAARQEIATQADIGGENVAGLLERVAQSPGAGRTTVIPFLTDRQTKQLSRISSDLKDLTGTSKTSLAAIDQKITERSTAAKPLYEQAFNEGDKVIWNKELERISAVPEVQSAMHSAISGWQRTQIANGYGAMKPGAMIDEKSGGILQLLHGKVPVFPNLQFWDYTKNALDDMISNEIKADGTMTKKGRDLTIIVGKLRDQLDQSVGSYKAARDAWGGPSAYINAINLGKKFSSASSEEVSATMARLDEPGKEAYRIGALSELFTKMGSKSANLADITAALRSPEMRGKISALMPTAQAAAKWHNILEFEVRSSEMVRQSLGNSATFRRLMEARDSGNLAGEMVADMFSGKPPLNLFGKLFQGTVGKVRDTLRSRTDAEIARQLTQRLGKSSFQQP